MFRLQAILCLAFLILKVSGATVTFDCSVIPETCNNMCYAASRGGGAAYNPMHYDSNINNRYGRRVAAGCKPNPNRCQTNPPTPARVTCDEYPFASTHGTGVGGWYAGTGATTRCVSKFECSSQGGTLSAFYKSFGGIDGTPITVSMSNKNASPYCVNPALPPDGDFASGNPPPNRRALRLDVAIYEYKTAGNRTIQSLSGPIDIGTAVFVPNLEWQNNPKVKDLLAASAEEDEDCDGTKAQMAAADMLEMRELGEFDKVIQRL